MAKSCASLAEISSFPAQVLVLGCIVFCSIGRWGGRKLMVEGRLAALTVMHVTKQIKVVVEEVCSELVVLRSLLIRLLTKLCHVG